MPILKLKFGRLRLPTISRWKSVVIPMDRFRLDSSLIRPSIAPMPGSVVGIQPVSSDARLPKLNSASRPGSGFVILKLPRLGRPGSEGMVTSGNSAFNWAIALNRLLNRLRSSVGMLSDGKVRDSSGCSRSTKACRSGMFGTLMPGKLTDRASSCSMACRFSDGRFRSIFGKFKYVAQSIFGNDGSVNPLKVNIRLSMDGSDGIFSSELKSGRPKLSVGRVRSKCTGILRSNRLNMPKSPVKPISNVLLLKFSTCAFAGSVPTGMVS